MPQSQSESVTRPTANARHQHVQSKAAGGIADDINPLEGADDSMPDTVRRFGPRMSNEAIPKGKARPLRILAQPWFISGALPVELV